MMLRLKHYCLFFSIAMLFFDSKASDKKITPQEQQQYLIHINNAMLYSADSLYQKACAEYELAFNYRTDYVIDLFECTKLYDKLDSTEKTLKYLKLSIEAGCYWYDNNHFIPNLKCNNQLPPASELEQYRKIYFQKINVDYLLELEKLLARDQAIRSGDLSQETEIQLMSIIDPEDIDGLKKLVEKYGYPDYSTAGYRGETDAFILLMHGLLDGIHDSLDWAYFQPIILQKVKDGSIMPEHYAFLYDRVMSNNGKGKQCYGMQWIVNSKGTYDFASFDDIENVDLRRREIGLLPLGDWIKYNHTKVPDGYIRK